MSRKITVHEGLAKLKLYDKKLSKNITSDIFTSCELSNKDTKTLESEYQSNYQSITDMIDEYQKIKVAISISNATTKVNLLGKDMTVIEAILLKNTLEYNEWLLGKLKEQYSRAKQAVEYNSQELTDKVESLLNSALGKDNTSNKSVQSLIDSFVNQNEKIVVNETNVKKWIEALEKYIDDVQTNIDFVLSNSNATTFIELD